jgi:hypothetical protein
VHDTPYTFRYAYPAVYQVGRAVDVSMPVYRDGALVAPGVGSTFQLVGPAGTDVIAATAVTVPDSVATYAIQASDIPATLPLGEGYQEVWTLVLDGKPRQMDREVALARRPLNPVISDVDLRADYPTTDRDLPPGFASWQSFLDEAWRVVVGRFIGEGRATYAVKSAWAFRDPHKHLTHALRFRAMAAARPSQVNYAELAKWHQDAYEAGWKSMTWTSDDDGDGRVDDTGRRRGGAAIVLPNVPVVGDPRRVPRDPRW